MSRSIEFILAALLIGYVLKGCATNSTVVQYIDKLF